jgi:hypothetical protein
MSTGLENKIKFDFNKPDFQQQFGGKTGTISEKRTEEADSKSGGGGGDAAEIIGASADGLDSIANFVGLFTGKPTATESNYTTAAPPEKKKVSPLVWIGGGLVVLLLIALLISSKNGQATIPQT